MMKKTAGVKRELEGLTAAKVACLCVRMCRGKRGGAQAAETGGNRRGRKDDRSRNGPDL